MTYDSFNNKLSKFIDDNLELVEEYNSINAVPLSACTYELYKQIENIKDIYPKLSVKTILSTIIPLAINESQTVIDIAEDIFSRDDFTKDDNKSALQIYFDNVHDIYEKNNNNYDIEYCQENREKLIEMNLKSVISIAKQYKGRGLPMEDLICAGNLGLCMAFDKFDPSRNKVKSMILEEISRISGDIEYIRAVELLSPAMSYGSIKKKFMTDFAKDKPINVKKLQSWVNHNVTNARFNSVAVMWIRAYILIELDNNSRTIKKNKSDIKMEKSNGRDVYMNLSDHVGDSGNNTLADILQVESETITVEDNREGQAIFKEGLSKLLTGVKLRNRRILMQKFGIGYPRPMTPKEIAEQEGLSIARVSQIVQATIEQMKKNQEVYQLDPSILYEAVSKMF